MQRLISTELKTGWPEFSFMGEEMDHDEQARIVLEGQDQGFWALDPLDGTTNFAMGFPFYGVSLALVKNGEPKLGVVYDPVRRECFSASAGGGAYLDGVPLKTLRRHQPRMRGQRDYKRLSPDWQTARPVSSVPVPTEFGVSAGGCVAAGRGSFSHGGQRMWDYAAGSLSWKKRRGLRPYPVTSRLPQTQSSAIAAITPSHRLWICWFGK